MALAWIALGSNLQQPARQLQAAVDAIAGLEATRIVAGSRSYTSAAIGPGQQPDYLNAVMAIATALDPEPLLDRLQLIERNQGRKRDLHWGPRTLDLDILLYEDWVIRSPRLQVPHPAMAQRHFVLYPLADIRDRNLPLPCGHTLADLLARCPADGLSCSDIVLDYHLRH